MSFLRQIFLLGTTSIVLATSSAGSASANGEGSEDAHDLVLQSIALIVSKPDDMHEIEEHIEGALEASNTAGVDINYVEQAAAAVEEGDLQHARDLLQTSIGAGPYVENGVPEPVREAHGEPGRPAFAVGAEAGTTIVLDEYRPDTGLDGGDIVLLVLSAAAVGLGALMAWTFRPPDTVRKLRRAAPGGEA